MATIVTRSGKGSALTHTEMDSNFTNLNTELAGAGGSTGGDLSARTVGADRIALFNDGALRRSAAPAGGSSRSLRGLDL